MRSLEKCESVADSRPRVRERLSHAMPRSPWRTIACTTIIGVMETTSAAVAFGPRARNVSLGQMDEAEQHGNQEARELQGSKGLITVGALAYEATEPREHGHDEKRQQDLRSDASVACELRLMRG